MKRLWSGGMALALCLTLWLSLPALAEATTCKHINAEWVVADYRYERVNERQHRVIPVLAQKLHCPDCGREVDVTEIDAQAVYDAAGPLVEQAREALKLAESINWGDLTSEEFDALSMMRSLSLHYDGDVNGFMQWVAEEGYKTAGAARLEAHSFNADGVCACGIKLSETAYVVSGNTKLKLNVGETLQIALKNATPKGWKAGSSKVVKLYKDGRIKGLKEGKTTVTITLKNKKKWKLTVTVVNPNKPQGIMLYEQGPLTLKKGQKQRLTPIVAPSDAITELNWKSSNSKVVSVSKDGVIKAKKKGTATVAVKTDNGLIAKIKVKVK